MAWYHNDAMDKAERWGTSLSSPRSYPGYFLLGSTTRMVSSADSYNPSLQGITSSSDAAGGASGPRRTEGHG